MSYVVGTAGHVDHGKSALIKALTGIDTAHLPQEKKRGMTIDLGFAYFEHQDGTPVGVIDVPGHERFIRNMVAGVWSLDMVLFVVAADEGWMQMSTDHLKVIASMGIDNVTLVISKSDLSMMRCWRWSRKKRWNSSLKLQALFQTQWWYQPISKKESTSYAIISAGN